MRNSIILFLAIFSSIVSSKTRFPFFQIEFEYDEQDSWEGMCQIGTQQSPIDIPDDEYICDDTLVFDFTLLNETKPIIIEDDGESFKAEYTDSKLYASDINGILTAYQSLNFHFHSPSEHEIDGESYDLELHFLHSITHNFLEKGLTKKLFAAVSIMFEVDDSADANPFIAALNLTKLNTPLNLNVNSLLMSQLPSPIPFYTYQGSVTTPPCLEIVNWYIVTTPLKITRSQLKVFKKRFSGNSTFADGDGNNRETQPVNGRTIKKGGVVCEEQFIYFFSFVIIFIVANYVVLKLL